MTLSIASEPRIPPDELNQYLTTLPVALRQAIALSGKNVTFENLPIEEWAGPAYAVAALFDPYVLAAGLPPVKVVLETDQGEKRASRKECIRFRSRGGRNAVYRLPMIWGGVDFHLLPASAEWRQIALVGEFAGCLVRPGEAVFAFHPLRVIHRYLNMAEPGATWDFTDLLIHAVLAAGGCDRELDDDDLRRDFHAFGINLVLLLQFGLCVQKEIDTANLPSLLMTAAAHYRAGDKTMARQSLGEAFACLTAEVRRLEKRPVYFMNLPHGGIQFANEGFAEFDSPEEAARVLNLYLDWLDKYDYHFAPDIGAGTLAEFAKTNPLTIARLRQKVADQTVEMVNGSYSQPYGHLFGEWDNRKQFERGQEVLTKLFGRPAETYASQEISLHPKLPDILADNGFRYALHRSQNLGLGPVDPTPLISWTGPDGKSVRALPSHPLRSDRRGGEIYRHLGVLLASQRNGDLPFIAFTNFIDQSFIDIYHEEVVRGNAYAQVWGKFVTPAEFFAATAALDAPAKRYRLDDYHYALGFGKGGGFHGHQTGGLSTKHVFLAAEARQLQQQNATGEALDAFLNREAHDCYIVPYFATGSFMEGGLTDYTGPRYLFANDGPRGIDRFVCDAAGYPRQCADAPRASPQAAAWDGNVLHSGGRTVVIDPVTGAVNQRFGRLLTNDAGFAAEQAEFTGDQLILTGNIASFGRVRLSYFIADGVLYAVIARLDDQRKWDMSFVEWSDAVYLRHVKTPEEPVIRTVCSVSQPTELELFHSLDTLTIGQHWLYHGGNIFFRQSGDHLDNRLWCYGEFCRSFWWGLKL